MTVARSPTTAGYARFAMRVRTNGPPSSRALLRLAEAAAAAAAATAAAVAAAAVAAVAVPRVGSMLRLPRLVPSTMMWTHGALWPA